MEKSFKGRRTWQKVPGREPKARECVPTNPQVYPVGWVVPGILYPGPEIPSGDSLLDTSPFLASPVQFGS